MRLALPSLSRTRTAVTAAVVAVVATAAATLVVADRPASGAAGPAPESGVPIAVLHSGKCLNVAKASTADKAPVVQYRCVGAANERWRAVPQDDGSYQLVAEHSGKCLNVSGGSAANSAALVQYRCVGAANEKWTPLSKPDSNRFTLVAQHSGKCLNVAGASTADGAAVVQYSCVSGAANAIWSGTPNRNAEPNSAGPTVGLQPGRGAALHLSYVDDQGRAWYGGTFPESGSITWSALPGEQTFTGTPALLPAGTGVQVLARSTHSDVFGVLPPGRARWTNTGGNVQSDPARGEGIAIAVGWDGRLWAAPDDGVHVPFLAWRLIPSSRFSYTGTPAIVPVTAGRYVFARQTDGTLRSAFLANGPGATLSPGQVVGTGVTGDFSVAPYNANRQVVTTTVAGQVVVKFQNATLDGAWPAGWTPLAGVTPSGPPQVIGYPGTNRVSVLVLDGETQKVKVATETAAGSRTFGAWQEVPSTEPIATVPVPFTYQDGLTGSWTWGFAVRTVDGETLLAMAAPPGTGGSSGFQVRSLPAPRR